MDYFEQELPGSDDESIELTTKEKTTEDDFVFSNKEVESDEELLKSFKENTYVAPRANLRERKRIREHKRAYDKRVCRRRQKNKAARKARKTR